MNLIEEFENIINCPICDSTLDIIDNGGPVIKKICVANNSDHDFILCRDFKVNIIQQINYIKTTEVSLMAMYFLHSNTTSYIIYLKNKTKTVSEEDYQRLYIYFKHNDPDKIKKVLMLL